MRGSGRTQRFDNDILIIVFKPSLAEVIVDVKDKPVFMDRGGLNILDPARINIIVENTFEVFARFRPQFGSIHSTHKNRPPRESKRGEKYKQQQYC